MSNCSDKKLSKTTTPSPEPRALIPSLSFLLLLLLAAACPVKADQTPSSSIGDASDTVVRGADRAMDEEIFPGLATRISLDLRGMDVVEVLKFLSTKGSFNLVADPAVSGRVTLTLTNVAVRDALEIILVSNGLAIERRGSILYVMPGDLYEQLYGHRYGDPRKSLILQLNYANPGQVGTLLGNIKSSVGRIVIDEPTATIALLDTPGVLAEMKTLIERVDIPSVERQIPTQTEVLALRFANAEDIQTDVESALTPDVGKLHLDKRSNALIVTDVPARLPKIRQLVQAFDSKNREVYIESTIVQVTLNDKFNTGIAWKWVSESGGNINFPDITITNSLPIASTATDAAELVFGTVSENDVTATIKALHTFGDTKVLSSPHISVMDGEEAKILVGRRQAYVTTTTTQAQSTATTAETIEFVDVGVKLHVTPTITESDFITLKIRPEVSSVATTLETSSGNTIPIVETAEAETQVMVKNGSTIVIGGLMKDTVTYNEEKVPLFGDIPIIGALFRKVSDEIEKTELVILMTPRLISGDETVLPAATTARVNTDW